MPDSNQYRDSARAKVVVLGATGMLGSMVGTVLSRAPELALTATVRNKQQISACESAFPSVQWAEMDAERASIDDLTALLQDADWAVNCIGVIKPYIKDDVPAQVVRAIRVNSLFPQKLGAAAVQSGAKILQIATDCVYSGSKGDYVEKDAHDALDVYGKSKSLGEASFDAMHHLRCSIIGPEWQGHLSLLDWFRGQPEGASLTGFTNHFWNGVTTYHYARLCLGVIRGGLSLPRLQHVVAGAKISKHDMLLTFQQAYSRPDLKIAGKPSATAIDRTLATADPDTNLALWQAAGYETPPSVPEMISEMSRYRTPFEKLAACAS